MSAADWTTKDYITMGLAGWGAGLSTALAIRQIWRDRPGVKVLVLALAAQGPEGEDWRDYWQVRVINVRQRPIELMAIGVHMRKRRFRNILEERVPIKGQASDKLPITLRDGDRGTFYFEREGRGIAGVGRLSGVWVRDSLDRQYVGRYRPNSPRELVKRFRWWSYKRRRDRRPRRRQRRGHGG